MCPPHAFVDELRNDPTAKLEHALQFELGIYPPDTTKALTAVRALEPIAEDIPKDIPVVLAG
jgi:hypothetical protein